MYRLKLLLFELCYFGWCLRFTIEAATWNKHDGRRVAGLNQRSFRDDSENYKQYERSEKPNIILIVTDDQDEMLGSMSTMTKTLKIMGQEGVRLNNSFVSTPMCCPSRSSLLTGLYPHNHHIFTNNDNCSGPVWQATHEPRTFAKYLSDAGYRTGFFGKYLNEYNGTYIPPGWREWVGLVKNSRYYNYTLNFNGQKVKHDDNYYSDYFTDLIANDSVTFLRMSKQYFPTKPVLMMVSTPAPHGPEDAAPQYQHMFENNTLHRTPSWNYVNNSDKQWLLKEMKPLDPVGIAFTDILQRKRLQTLQSVDNLVEKVYYQLRLLGELDNTYIIYTSDHGYHLGQFGVVKGKALPYDFDIRVPLYVRGPGILRDTVIPNIVGNIDIAPTILDMAGIEVPEHIDGRSILKLIKSHKLENNFEGNFVQTKRPWRDTLLIERGKVTPKMIKDVAKYHDEIILNDHEEELIPFAHKKLRRTLKMCKDPANQPPCKAEQKWVCFKDDRQRKRLRKCRNYNMTIDMENDYQKEMADNIPAEPAYTKHNPQCECSSARDTAKINFQKDMSRPHSLNDRVNTHGHKDRANAHNQRNAEKMHMPRNISKHHLSRSSRNYARNYMTRIGSFRNSFRKRRSFYVNNESDIELNRNIIAQQLESNKQRCRFYANDTFACDKDITKDPMKWQSHQIQIDEMIEETKTRLKNLKKIKKNMRKHGKYFKKNIHVDDTDSNEIDWNEKEETVVNVNEEQQQDCECDDQELDPSETDPEQILTDDQEESEEEDDRSNQHSSFVKQWSRRKDKNCDHDELKCTIQFDDHWATPPYWTYGPYCYCTNAVSNTYWCLRTINETHDFLYCEFIDSFLSYYDLKINPHQLQNQIKSLSFTRMEQLHKQLDSLRKCEHFKQCSIGKDEVSVTKTHHRKRRLIRNHRMKRFVHSRPIRNVKS